MPERHPAFDNLLELLRPPMNRQHVSLESLSTGRAEDFFHDGRIVVFTDGACSNNQDDRFRKAGYGAYWADGHALNFSLALEGWAQTNNRAELMAVIQTMEQEGRPLEIRTDSRYGHNGALFHIASWRESGWRHVSNADLWQRLDKALSLRCKDSVRFVKVKGAFACASRRGFTV
ncbi:unnamed protein product [Polarella glacialis]|uniref:ribonuclease H n=1 Tax=Polarella glacialis TaxID=89957 RepID=A0A813H387_POLGL|nr:unnamed protein product [Polarella glacialis]